MRFSLAFTALFLALAVAAPSPGPKDRSCSPEQRMMCRKSGSCAERECTPEEVSAGDRSVCHDHGCPGYNACLASAGLPLMKCKMGN
ncbi:hypothetical protein BZA05DRAFT_413804 [Tricharina praecox]|uniref:uncharacterized protein n=1 Tax=Tricharina praecox TaxID=43433 RepID=UPI00221EA2BB|nr:uncharacterized protein BZA05DRAFT_413804 [Tricharina praecox]KAI5840891.1 hypothetical protein BZA05DRAFT_413804 [Tricharina praecox]